jgi:hypothetical protein
MNESVSAGVPGTAASRAECEPSPQAPGFGTPAWWTFYLVLPLMMALPLGWYGAGLAAELPLPASMILWTVVCLVSWWMADLLARLLANWMRVLSPPPWTLLIGGYALNLMASSVYNPWVVEFLLRTGLAVETPALAAYFELDRSLLEPAYLWLLAVAGLPGLVCWLAGNFALETIGGVPRFRSASALQRQPVGAAANGADATGTEAPPASPPFFRRLQRLDDLRADELIALEAADHYIQVHTLRGKEMVHYRFGDALGELGAFSGLQIHRSAWVSDHGVARLDEAGRSLSAILVTGDRLPVSLPNRNRARARFSGTQAGLRSRM